MCYSAKVQQNLRSLAKRFGADVDWEMLEEIFRRRLKDDDIKIARSFESNFQHPESDTEKRIWADIEAYRQQVGTQWETDLFAQKRRLANAERSLKEKPTKKSQEDQRISSAKIDTLMQRLTNLRRTEFKEADERIFPRYFAPIIVRDHGKLLVRPMRYQCRLSGKPLRYDTDYPGTYNARRDNLEGFWSDVYGSHHGIMVVNSFYENVANNVYEKRELQPGERPKNMVLHFNPQPASEMWVACLWSHWTKKGEEDLYSFAAITDEPPPEIAATGHNRCIIALKESNAQEWLSPEGLSKARLEAILSARQSPYYEHRVAA